MVQPTPFYTPTKDRGALTEVWEPKPGLPDVLLIGDSISIGYTRPVRSLLENEANIHRPNTNCGDTRLGVEKIDEWLGLTSWKVIHFNFGLHDLCYRHPESKEHGRRDKVRGSISVPLEKYGTNLDVIVSKLRNTGARLVFATTTVVPEGEPGRHPEDPVKYNEVATGLMQKYGIPINNLHELTKSFSPARFVGPGDVHFTAEGYRVIGEQVANCLLRWIK
jgi:hypothetical protein